MCLLVLDEATSQVGVAMERELYLTCARLGITVLSVGHRDSLREFHQRELHIDAQSGRWHLNNITHNNNNDNNDNNAASSRIADQISININDTPSPPS